jgi:hypothetical protein
MPDARLDNESYISLKGTLLPSCHDGGPYSHIMETIVFDSIDQMHDIRDSLN